MFSALSIAHKTLSVDRTETLVSEETNGIPLTGNTIKLITIHTTGDAIETIRFVIRSP